MSKKGFEPPSPLDFSSQTLSMDWKKWQSKFARYRLATKLDKEDGIVQVSQLLYAMGDEAETIYETYNWPGPAAAGDPEPKEVYEEVTKMFNEHFIPKLDTVHERDMFVTRKQQPGETVESFLRALHTLFQKCNYEDDKRDEYVKDRFIPGLLDKTLNAKLRGTPGITLADAVGEARRQEAVAQQLGATGNVDKLGNGSNGHKSNNYRGRGRGRGQSGRGRGPRGNNSGKGSKQDECNRCGLTHGSDEFCKAMKYSCRKCGKKGHFAKKCPNNNQGSSVREVDVPELYGQDWLGLLSLDSDNNTEQVNTTQSIDSLIEVNDSDEPEWAIRLLVENKHIKFKVDPGADVTLITKDTYESLKPKPKLVNAQNLNSPGGKVDVLGSFITQVPFRNNMYQFKIHVENGKCRHNLLGRATATRMGLVIKRSDLHVDTCGKIKTSPVMIRIKEDTIPYHVAACRRVAEPMYDLVKKELVRMVREDIIVKVTEPTDWCAPMVPVWKKNKEDVRVCVDFTKMNRSVLRENFVIPTAEELLAKLHGAKMFSCLDAESGYWQLELDPECRNLTTFTTPFGRFAFKRLPQGISCASEIFQRKMTEVLEDLEGVLIYQDDILVYGANADEHDKRLKAVMERLKSANVRLNMKKCQIKKPEVQFLGRILSGDGVSPDPEKVQAVLNLPAPEDVEGLRRVIGMIHYLGSFLPNLSEVMAPMFALLKSDVVWMWGPSQDSAFKKAKELVSSAPALAYYNPKLQTTVSADASSYGLGATIMQKQEDGKLRPIAFASRTLTDTEKRYAQLEKECLATVWACERFEKYLYGMSSFRMETDHKPLVPLMMQKDLDRVPIRCQRLLMRMMRFNAKVVHVPGKSLVVADTLSRHPMQEKTSNMEEEINLYVDAVRTEWPASEGQLKNLVKTTAEDVELQDAINMTLVGWPEYIRDVPPHLREYHQFASQLSVHNGLLLNGKRIVIPKAMREDTLKKIHDGHLGLSKCRVRANEAVWWPHIGRDIQYLINTCQVCQRGRPSQKREPLIPTPLPEEPWERVGSDLLELDGKKFLVVTDYYSRYIELCHMRSTTTMDVINKLKNIFARWGIPSILVTDNGPQYGSQQFRDFVRQYCFEHVTSSPRYPQANGAAEAAVKIAKRMLVQEDVNLALMTYRNTPLEATGLSPNELMLQRRVRDRLPILNSHCKPKQINKYEVQERHELYQQRHKTYYDNHYGAQEMQDLRPGDSVRIKLDTDKEWSPIAKVEGKANTPRSYLVNTGNRVLRRNRRHLQYVPPGTQMIPTSGNLMDKPIEVENTPNNLTPLPLVPQSPTVPAPLNNSSTPTGTPVTTTRSGRVSRPPTRLDM
jgi:transposase InsO family protein